MLMIRWEAGPKSTMTGEVWREVPCEHCGEYYFYSLHLKAQGWQTGSHHEAFAKLCWLAEHKVEPVPCPACGRYQAKMSATLRSRQYSGFRIVGVILFVAALFAGTAILSVFDKQGNGEPPLPVPTLILLTLAFSIASWLCFKSQAWLETRYDPNNEADAEDRIAIARERAFLAKDLEARGIDLRECDDQQT